VDLRALWARLGVEDAGGRIQFRDDAPLAAIRKAITAGVDPGRPATPRP
jgi:hypothetical protein